MALAALCDDSEWGRTWRDVLQHRFAGAGPLARPRGRQPADRRALGAARRHRRAAWTGRPAARRPGPGAADGGRAAARSRPASLGADPAGPTSVARSAARSRSPSTPGGSSASGCCPQDPPACPEAVERRSTTPTGSSSGPGSWFTRVLPHLLVPGLSRGARARPGAQAARRSTWRTHTGRDRRASRAENHLEVLAAHAPELRARRRAGRPERRRRTRPRCASVGSRRSGADGCVVAPRRPRRRRTGPTTTRCGSAAAVPRHPAADAAEPTGGRTVRCTAAVAG